MDDVEKRFAEIEAAIRELGRRGERLEWRMRAMREDLDRTTKTDYQLLLEEVRKEHRREVNRGGESVRLSDLKRHEAERLEAYRRAGREVAALEGEPKGPVM